MRPILSCRCRFAVLALSSAALLVGCAPQGEGSVPTPEPLVEAVDNTVVSLLGQPLSAPELPAATRERLEANLAAARDAFDADPEDEENIIWLGRRLAYLSRYGEAIAVFTRGLELHPDSYRLRRHRGHRYITTRRFDLAVSDLAAAAELAAPHEDAVEPDGAPNALNIPLGTDKFNIWYHLGLAHYLQGDFDAALEAYRECLAVSTNPDLLVATTDWMVMTLRRLDRVSETEPLLAAIEPEMEIIENDSYHRRLLMYRGLLEPGDLLDLRAVDDPDVALNIATQGYGVGNWLLTQGDAAAATEVFERIVEGTSWAAFGYVAAEAELARAAGSGG